MSYNMWSYFLRNYFRGHLNCDHTHARLVLSSVMKELNDNNLHNYMNYIENSWNKYNSNKINLFESGNMIKSCSDDIAKMSPKYYYYPIKFEESLIKKNYLKKSILNKIFNNK